MNMRARSPLIPRPQGVAMSTTVNHDSTSGYGGRDDVSRRGTKRVSIVDTTERPQRSWEFSTSLERLQAF